MLLEQGRYGELLSMLDGIGTAGRDSAEAVLWRVRCRVDQGYLRVAADLVSDLPAGSPVAGETGQLLRLWRGFLAIHDTGNGRLTEPLDVFAEQCDELECAADAGDTVRAVAADLRGRIEAVRFTLSGRGPRHRGEVMTTLARSASRYRAAGLRRESAASLRRAATFGALGLAADRSKARELLMRAYSEAGDDGLPVACAAARLSLAELDFRDLLDGHGRWTLQEMGAEFDAIAACYRDGGHAFGDALVHWCAARWLLAYGVADGLDEARMAAATFAAADVPSMEQPVWAALNLWHTLHGDPAATREARAEESRLASAMGLTMAAEIRVLDEANQSFRGADVARARSLLAQRPTSPSLDSASRLLAVTSAMAVGLHKEARALAEGLIADLTAAGADLVLGEILLVLASMLMGRDDDRAAALLVQAAELAHAAEAPVDEAKYWTQLAWITAHRRKAQGAVPAMDDQVLAEFDRAEALLKGQRSLQARAELAMLYELRGQAAFVCADWDACGTWLTQAEHVARSSGLLPHLAAICCIQGLVLIELGRSRGPQTYDHAAGRLDESRSLYERVDLPAFTWQVIFHRALCDIESARWLPPGERAERHTRAIGLLEEASHLIDRIRDSAEYGSAAPQQRTRMAFSVNKQVFYTQGFQFSWDERRDPVAAWQWLERMKGRALLDALTDRSAAPRADGPPTAASRTAARRSEPPGFAEIRSLLAAEERASVGRRILVAGYACAPRQTLLFGARADWDTPRVAQIPLDHARLSQFASETFRAPGGVRTMRDRPDGGIAAWHEFSSLLDPLAAWTDPDDLVYLVPHGILHDLPLHTLTLDGMPLIERNPVCYVPAAAVLRHTLCGAASSGPYAPAAVFGDSRGNLPDARQEAAEVAALLGVAPVVGGNVTRKRVLRALATASVVHIAGHGRLAAADGFASSLDLAGADMLRADDLLGWECRARLVVLSGCQTGAGEQRAGDEVVGFVRALLLSGAGSILASQWRVNDASTRELLRRFHQATAGGSVPSLAEALRQAVRDIRAEPGYDHLYHWGGFTLAGSWR